MMCPAWWPSEALNSDSWTEAEPLPQADPNGCATAPPPNIRSFPGPKDARCPEDLGSWAYKGWRPHLVGGGQAGRQSSSAVTALCRKY